MAIEQSDLVLIAYDGTDAADGAVREAGVVFAGRPALVLSVWNTGVGYELAQAPGIGGVSAAPVDVRAAQEVDDVIRERAQETAQRGANLAREAGFSSAEAVAVASEPDRSIPVTIVRAAEERGAQVIVVGAHAKGRLSAVILGSTSRDVLRHATRPVLVIREAPAS